MFQAIEYTCMLIFRIDMTERADQREGIWFDNLTRPVSKPPDQPSDDERTCSFLVLHCSVAGLPDNEQVQSISG